MSVELDCVELDCSQQQCNSHTLFAQDANFLASISGGRYLLLYGVTLSPSGSGQQTSQKKMPAVAAPSTQAEHWSGDLDGLLKRWTIRVVVSYFKTQYYVLKGKQYGISYEGGRAFEKYINQKYSTKTKNLSLHNCRNIVLHLREPESDGSLRKGLYFVSRARLRLTETC